jgi:hypothetical protein
MEEEARDILRQITSTARLQPSRALMLQQWRLATQLISKLAAFNYWTLGQAHGKRMKE